MALWHITGNPRAGKTSFVVAKNLTENMAYTNWRYKAACQYIKNINRKRGLEKTLPPQRHVVFSNVDILKRFPTMSSYRMSGWEFGAPNRFCPATKPLMPYGVYIFDEAQRYFDSKDEIKLPPWVTQAFELRGHIFLEIFLITQRSMRLHKDVRAIVDERVHIEKSVHTYLYNGEKIKSRKFLEHGQLVKTVWYGRKFKSGAEHERYIDGDKPEDKELGVPFKFTFDGDIKSHYDPYAYAVEMEDLNNDFDYYDQNEITERPEEWTNYKKKVKNGKSREDQAA